MIPENDSELLMRVREPAEGVDVLEVLENQLLCRQVKIVVKAFMVFFIKSL